MSLQSNLDALKNAVVAWADIEKAKLLKQAAQLKLLKAKRAASSAISTKNVNKVASMATIDVNTFLKST